MMKHLIKLCDMLLGFFVLVYFCFCFFYARQHTVHASVTLRSDLISKAQVVMVHDLLYVSYLVTVQSHYDDFRLLWLKMCKILYVL